MRQPSDADFPRKIKGSGRTIYDALDDRPDLLIPAAALERLLNRGLAGQNLDYPIRSRSKILKAKVCEILGYPVPPSFKRTKPRFPGQNLDTYVQKANNLQIWNEQITASRRYALIRVDVNHRVTAVKLVSGNVLARLDRTGTLTHKYQARSRGPVVESTLVSLRDTQRVAALLPPTKARWRRGETGPAAAGGALVGLLPIGVLFGKLTSLVGSAIVDPGRDQERHRGALLHAAVCRSLRCAAYADSGQFPDVLGQLLEVKLQTAPTIDLGLVCPDSTDPIAALPAFRHCDVRYAVFYADAGADGIVLRHLVVVTGADFFQFFKRFEGRVVNRKLQIPLPGDFFD